MSAEELRQERIETIEALKHTQDVSGGSSKLFGELGRKTGWLFTYGAASSVGYTGGDNGSDRSEATSDANDHTYDYELKPFVNITNAARDAKFYTRATTKYSEAKKNTGSIRGNNFIQPVVEMAYWEKKYKSLKNPAVNSTLTIGRQFMQVGRGIAFAQTVDGILYDVRGLAGKKGEWKAFVAKQNPSDDNIDASSSGSGRTKRFFYGMRGKYNVHPKAKMSLYTVHVKDENKVESPNSAFQKHLFEPQYYGVVSEGRVTKDLQYWGEYMIERGETYDSSVAGVASKIVNLRASGWTLGMRYYFGGDLAPTLFGEYVTGTGDPDALTSSNSPLGGSYPGTNDSRFNTFGGIGMGLALAPTMTNIKVYKVGGSIKPFARSINRLIQDISLTPEYFLFRRRTGNLGASGNDAVLSAPTVTSNRIGDEFDMSISWRLMSDVTYQLKYGHFSPGSAYPTTSSETYWKFKLSLDL